MNKFLTTKEAAEFLGWKPQALDMRRYNKLGPKYYRVGRSIRYTMEDLEDFIQDGAVEAPVDGGAAA